jgi:predicted enzyme related to lactoylglutathione lyase
MRKQIAVAALLLTVAVASQPGVAAQNTAAAKTVSPVVGVGNFSHIVQDLDKSLAFYRDVLGLEVANSMAWGNMPAIMQLGNTPGAQSRMAALRVPGSQLGVELIEYKDIDRKPQAPRFQDPGAANLGLTVRDLSAILPKLVPAGGKILTPNAPTVLNGGRYVFVQDPDGFIVEVVQPPDVATRPGTGNVLGGVFELTVANSEESVKFYNELLGFNMTLGASFNDNQTMATTAGTPGASFRQSRAPIPGTTVTMTLIEFKNIERRTLSGRTQDPGTAILQLRVSDVTALTAKLKAAGARVVTTGSAPVQIGNLKIALVSDPNNLLLELMQ